MLNWLRSVIAGKESEVPDGVNVERDALDRVTKAEFILNANATDVDNAISAPSPTASLELQNDFKLASKALLNKNFELIETYGLGTEENYSFDQDTHELTILFPDGRKLIADSQILGSFDPSRKTFLWAWANPSFKPELTVLARQIKSIGESKSESLLTTSEQKITFELIKQLMAFSIHEQDAEDIPWQGVYRAMAPRSVSVFVAFRVKHLLSADESKIELDDFVHPLPSKEQIAEAVSLVANYDKEMYLLDLAHNQKDERGIDHQLLDKKVDAYNTYWQRDDNYWQPSSFGWPSDYKIEQYRFKIISPVGISNSNQGILVGHAIDKSYGISKQVYKVEFFEGGPKITDGIITWGEGFIWPSEV